MTIRGVGLLVLVLGLGLGAGTAAADVNEGERAPELRGVVTPTGKKARIGKFKGRVVVMTFGASWCPPCKKELPALEKVAKRYFKMKSKAVFIAINTDEEIETGRKFMESFGLDCVKVGYNGDGMVGIYNPNPQPSTYIIDKNGIVRHIHKGYHPGDENKIADWVDKLDR
jgi:thiol-disulfide isomerase/thioredoxin